MTDDERYMRMALDLAASGPFCSPNPKVGAVIVKDGQVIGRGVHRGPGTEHAEVAALRGIDCRGATCYVNLEPCLHEGLTPPCGPALVAAGIGRLVVASEDPDHRVRGAGIAYLKAHGIAVEVGVLADEARRENAAYLHHRATGRSYLTLKLAFTLDARLSVPGRRWVTGAEARRAVHQRRAEVDAVMVGAGSIAADDPLLTVRDVASPRQPLRIVVDSSGRSKPSAAVFDDSAPTLVATTHRTSHETLIAWKEAGAEVLVLGEAAGRVDLAELLASLGTKGLLEIYCEGGARLASALLAEGLVNQLELHYAPVFGGSDQPGLDLAAGELSTEWRTASVARAGDDVMLTLERA